MTITPDQAKISALELMLVNLYVTVLRNPALKMEEANRILDGLSVLAQNTTFPIVTGAESDYISQEIGENVLRIVGGIKGILR